jgi:hypothetical protein
VEDGKSGSFRGEQIEFVDLFLDGLATVNCSIWAKIAATKEKASATALVTWAYVLRGPQVASDP